jgi:glucose-6-phosphate-specific signal transduction histidine kinase
VRDVVGAMRGQGSRMRRRDPAGRGDDFDQGNGEVAFDLGLVLRDLVRDTPGLLVHLDLPALLDVEAGPHAQCVVRCVQEIVTNTLRHAHASNLWIRIQRDRDGIAVDARDDGRGAPAFRPGHGLRGMQERLEDLGGWLRVSAPAARDFSLSAWLPGDGVPS